MRPCCDVATLLQRSKWTRLCGLSCSSFESCLETVDDGLTMMLTTAEPRRREVVVYDCYGAVRPCHHVGRPCSPVAGEEDPSEQISAVL